LVWSEILLSHPTYCPLIGPWFMVVPERETRAVLTR
jgi:hypothetical protein